MESVNTACDIYIVYQPLIERFGSSGFLISLATSHLEIGLPEATQYFPTRKSSSFAKLLRCLCFSVLVFAAGNESSRGIVKHR